MKRIFSGSMSDLRVVPWDAPLSPYIPKGRWRAGGIPKLHWTSGCGRTEKVGPDIFDIPIPQRLSRRTLVALAIYVEFLWASWCSGANLVNGMVLQQAAARHRSLLEKSRGAGAATAATAAPASSG